jgi:hypothetical protein
VVVLSAISLLPYPASKFGGLICTTLSSAAWRDVSWTFRLLLIVLTFGVAGVNAVQGVYLQLVAAFFGAFVEGATGIEPVTPPV